MTIKMIVAYDNNFGIGNNNELLFHIKEDLKRFKQLTSNSTVVMGRKTYESLPEANRPLPNRHNIILTKGTYNANSINVSVLNSISQVLDYSLDKDIWVIGGSTLYEQLLPYTEEIYVTHILSSKKADSYFPSNQLFNDFIEVERECHNNIDLSYNFITYARKH